MRKLCIIFAAIASWLPAAPLHAHATSTSYLVADATMPNHGIALTWDVAAAQVHWAIDLDTDGNGQITWHEVEQRRNDIAALALAHLQVARGGRACKVELSDLALAEHAGGTHFSLGLDARCGNFGAVTISATLFFDSDATQRSLVDVHTDAGQFTTSLSPATPSWTEPAAPSLLSTFATFVGQGLWHVWIGYDHLAFLLLLILPGVLRSVGGQWSGAESTRGIARDLLQVVTAFTLAHSVTLALAATGIVSVPERPIEIAIAASIVIAGLLNLFPGASRSRLALAFGFGLVHGFGFANALAGLGQQGGRLVPTLAGFNVGVELAQLSLVAVTLPLLLRVRLSSYYAWRFMPAASLMAAMSGAAWLAARAG